MRLKFSETYFISTHTCTYIGRKFCNLLNFENFVSSVIIILDIAVYYETIGNMHVFFCVCHR